MSESIYGKYKPAVQAVMDSLVTAIQEYSSRIKQQ